MKKSKSNNFQKRVQQAGHIIFALSVLVVLFFTVENPPNALHPWQAVTILILGLVVGLVDIKKEHSVPFLLAFLGIIIVSNAPIEVINFKDVGIYIKSFLTNMAVFLTFAVVITSTRIIYRIYKDSAWRG